MQKIHTAVARQLKLIQQNISKANSIVKNSKEQRSLCINEIMENANLWGGFIQDISLDNEDLEESIREKELEAA